jgi:dienelactone hydrolase
LKLSRVIALCLAASGASLLHAQKIEVVPSQAMIDESASVLVTGAMPGARVTIRAELTDGRGHPWSSSAEFVADAAGSVDTAKQAPLSGSYHIVSAMGLVWSMLPDEKGVRVYWPPDKLAPQTIRFHLLLDGKEASSAQLVQVPIRPGVTQIHVNGELHGTLYVPEGEGRHPAVLVLGGSEGGTPDRRAAWLASRGYVAFALCYFGCAGTPPHLANIPLEYFGRAIGWMAHRPEVAPGRIGVMGTSRGGEVALQIGTMYVEIKAVIAYVPANVRHPACCLSTPYAAWTWHGNPLTWVRPMENQASEASWNAAIGVENLHGPVLLIGGRSDLIWPSADMVEAAAGRLRKHHFPYPVVVLNYDHAGHRAGLPEITPTWHHVITHASSGFVTDYGGTPEGDAESSLDAIPKVLDFLKKNLADQARPTDATAKRE